MCISTGCFSALCVLVTVLVKMPLSPYITKDLLCTPKPRAEGSSPSAPAKKKHRFFGAFSFCKKRQNPRHARAGAKRLTAAGGG